MIERVKSTPSARAAGVVLVFLEGLRDSEVGGLTGGEGLIHTGPESPSSQWVTGALLNGSLHLYAIWSNRVEAS